MKVLKFGGTSVGTPQSLYNVREIVISGIEYDRQIVVVSALGGLTDQLIATAKLAVEADKGYIEKYNAMIERHHAIIEAMVPDLSKDSTRQVVDSLLSELGDIYKGISLIRDLSQRSLDKIVSYGERMSAAIVSAMLPGSFLFDSRDFIKTSTKYGAHVLDVNATSVLIHQYFDNADFRVAIVPGFISTNSDDIVTNLGRGGSDYTAAILAAELNAESLEIWTDVDGFLTADPRMIENTRIIDSLSFIEAMELCNLGAKVVYPPTIYPVFHKNIPIFIKNTFNPSVAGTRICDVYERESGLSLKGVSSVPECCLMFIEWSSQGTDKEISLRVLNALARNEVNVTLAESNINNGLAFSVKMTDKNRAEEVIRAEFKTEFETGEMHRITSLPNLATIGIVGENIRPSASQILLRIRDLFAAETIKIYATSPEHNENSISVVVDESNRRTALAHIHKLYFS